MNLQLGMYWVTIIELTSLALKKYKNHDETKWKKTNTEIDKL